MHKIELPEFWYECPIWYKNFAEDCDSVEEIIESFKDENIIVEETKNSFVLYFKSEEQFVFFKLKYS